MMLYILIYTRCYKAIQYPGLYIEGDYSMEEGSVKEKEGLREKRGPEVVKRD